MFIHCTQGSSNCLLLLLLEVGSGPGLARIIQELLALFGGVVRSPPARGQTFLRFVCLHLIISISNLFVLRTFFFFFLQQAATRVLTSSKLQQPIVSTEWHTPEGCSVSHTATSIQIQLIRHSFAASCHRDKPQLLTLQLPGCGRASTHNLLLCVLALNARALTFLHRLSSRSFLS